MACKLEEVEEQRRDLVANVSHELRTPIAALRARLENLADGIEELDKEAVATMLKATERLGKLVDQLLLLSQFESGAVRIDRQSFLAREVIEDASAEIRPVSPDVRITADVDDELAGAGDPERLHEVLTNLLTNAVRHSHPGGEVRVRGTPIPSGVRFEVCDDGSGVAGEDVERIFDRFYRVEAARKFGAGGA